MKIGEMFVQLGVKADTFTVKDFAKSIGDIPFAVAGAITSVTGLSFGFGELTKNVMNMATGLRVFTAETGLNDKALQQWQLTAKEMGLQAEDATSFLSRIAALIGGLRTGHADYGALQALGQMGVRDMSGTVYDIANRIQAASLNKDRITATSLLTAAGFSGNVRTLFDVPMARRENMTPALNRGTEKQVADFQKAVADFENTVTMHFAPILEMAIPPMIKLADSITQLLDWFSTPQASHVAKELRAIDRVPGDVRKWMDSVVYGKIQNRTMRVDYASGDVTYNFNGLTESETLARRITEEHMRRETMEHTKALKTFGNAGIP